LILFSFVKHVFGKQIRVSFSSSDYKTREILELVHLDLFLLMVVASIERSKYFITFVDNFSRKSWV
jgi:hypothetical protein